MEVNTRDLMASAKFLESYSRFLPEEGRYESWEEAVGRVMNTHREKYADKIAKQPELAKLIDEAEVGYVAKKVLGAQRALQFGGPQIVSHNLRMYNCTATFANRPAFFGESMYVLLCGAGAGVSVQKHHVAQLPMVRPRTKQAKIFTVPDSIQGWAQAIDVLMSSFFIGGGVHPEYEGRRVHFEYHLIRKKGAPISGGFLAPGADPLRLCLTKMEDLLVSMAEEGILRPIHVYDLGMYIADAVLAGGVRRAATIYMFSIDDTEMMGAKIGDWFVKNPQRARSNNSVICLRDQTTFEQFGELLKYTKQFGEPGVIFVDSLEHAFNPCVTADTLVATTEGLKMVKDLINVPFTALVNGKSFESSGFWATGGKPVFEVKTKRGYSIKATQDHKVLIRQGKKDVWVKVGDLLPGDKFVLNNNQMAIEINGHEFDRGWLLGEIVGDGCYNPDAPSGYRPLLRFWGSTAPEMAEIAVDRINSEFPKTNARGLKPLVRKDGVTTVQTVRLNELCDQYISPLKKDIDLGSLKKMTPSFIAGFLRGWFDADGSVQQYGEKGRTIRLTSSNAERLRIGQIMLAALGIASTIHYVRQKAQKRMGYMCNEVHELIISRDNIDRFAKLIGFYEPQKAKRLEEMLETRKKSVYRDRFVSEVVSVEACGAEEVYDCTVDDAHCFSANGLIVHNCVEIGLNPVSENGETGWAVCNLTEINGKECDTKQKFFDACKIAAILGTLQAGYTDFKFLSDATKKIVEREALLGVSLTGWLNSPETLLDEDTLRQGVEIVKTINEKVAALIGIRSAARLTCVKPAGNASVLLGTASGIHPEDSPRYLRHVQMNKQQEVAQILKETNPYLVEESVWSKSGNDYAISFPVIAPTNSIFKKDMTAIQLLEIVKKVQMNWVTPGTVKSRCVDPLMRHNVSNTITVSIDEWEEVGKYLYSNREHFTGVSLVADSGAKDYHQAPFTAVLTDAEIIAQYGSAALFASGLIVDASKGFSNLWEACDVAIDPNNDTSSQELKDIRSDWVRRFNKFSANHFGGDLKKTSYCLKDVMLLYKWTKIQQNFVEPELEDRLKIAKATDIDTMAAASCHGGGCEF